MADGQWASISRDTMQKVVEHLHGMGVLDGVQWAYLRRVCHGWNQRIISLLDVLPPALTDSGKYRTVRLPARRDLELFLLRNYPHRIHALSSVSWHAPQALSALAHIFHEGCGLNLFQLPLLQHSVMGFFKFFGMNPYPHNANIQAAVEDQTGDLYLFVSWTNETSIDPAELRELEGALMTKRGQSIFAWHTFSLVDMFDHSTYHKRDFETKLLQDRGFVFIFRNRDADVEAGRCFDYGRRKIAKTLRQTAARKRTRPDLNPAEKRLVRMRMARGADVESVSDE